MREKLHRTSKSVKKNKGKFEHVSKVVMETFGKEVKDLIQIKPEKRPSVHRVECVDGEDLRLDIKYALKYTELQILAYNNGVNVPKTLKYISGDKWRFCEWIEGMVLEKVWYLDEVFIKQGELIAKLNNTRCSKTGKYITNTDTNPNNFIWTPNRQIYFIDFNKAALTSNITMGDGPKGVDRIAASGAMKNLQYWPCEDRARSPRGKIELFLKGYERYRSTDNIIKILDRFDWDFYNFARDYRKRRGTK